MKTNPNWFHKILLKWIFNKVVKQGNASGIREIYRELFKVHQIEFTEDNNESIGSYMHEILSNAVSLESIEAKIKESHYHEYKHLKYMNEYNEKSDNSIHKVSKNYR